MNEKSSHFFGLIRDYLTVYLPDQKGASPNTAKSYREALSLLLDYICTINGLVLGKLNFTHLSKEAVEGFLYHLEIQRKCSVTTRNNRLASIRSFVKYACGRDISIQACYIDLCEIPLKKQVKTDILPYFSESALKTILEQPDSRKKKGLRDLFFMILMYDTGARNQEMLDIRLRDLHFEGKSPYVVITGKGRKIRLVPVMQKTVEHFKKYAAGFPPRYFLMNFSFILNGAASDSPCHQTIPRDSLKNMVFLHIVSIKKFQNHYTPIYSVTVAAYIYTEAECRWYCYPSGLAMHRYQQPCTIMLMLILR